MKFKLTVVIRDDAPMVFCGDCPSYRTVVVNLTEEQSEKLKLLRTGKSGNTEYHEHISTAILEEVDGESDT